MPSRVFPYPCASRHSIQNRSFMLQILNVSFSGVSFCQAGYEVSNFLCLEYTFQFGARTVRAFCGGTVIVLVDLGFGRSLPAQKAPSLARSVRCRWYSRLIVTILTDPGLLRRPHWRWRWIRVDFPPFRPSEQWIDCRDRRGHETYADLHVREERDQRVIPGYVD